MRFESIVNLCVQFARVLTICKESQDKDWLRALVVFQAQNRIVLLTTVLIAEQALGVQPWWIVANDGTLARF